MKFMLMIDVEEGHLEWFKNDPIDYLKEMGQLNFTNCSEYEVTFKYKSDPVPSHADHNLIQKTWKTY